MMAKKLKKVFAILLCVSMLMSMLSITAFAEGAAEEEPAIVEDEYTNINVDRPDVFKDIKFELFNYTGDTNADTTVDGINSNDVADYFRFRGSHMNNTAEGSALMPQNTLWDDDGYTADRVQLQSYLTGTGKYPVVDTSRAKALSDALKLMPAGFKVADAATVMSNAETAASAAQTRVEEANAALEAATTEEANAAAVAEKTSADQAKVTADAKLAAATLVHKYATDTRYKDYFTDARAAEIKALNVPDSVSLGFLFGAGGGTAVEDYEPENTILRYNPATKTYSYSSTLNAVDYIESENRFYVRDYTERTTTSEGSYKHGGNDFLPFNNGVDGRAKGTETGAYLFDSSKEVDYWFGMTMEYDFWMPAGGKIDSKDMVFEFSGDDDVWVFIDDQLVLDLGGTHGTVSGKINFATGEVTQYLSWLGGSENNTENVETTVDGKTTLTEATSFPTTLKERGVAAAGSNTIAEKEKHTLKFFYLERASAVANCSLSFNMPVIPAGMVTVEKQVEGDSLADADQAYTFVLKKEDGTPKSGAKYTIDAPDAATVYQTDADGKFTLKNGEMAFFTSFNSGDEGYYVIAEESIPGFIGSISCDVNGKAKAGAETSKFRIHPTTSNAVTFTNTLKEGSFSFKKTDMEGNPLEGAQFNLKGTHYDETATSDRNGVVSFADIPFGYTYTLTETGAPDEYETDKTEWPVSVNFNEGTNKVDVILGNYSNAIDDYLVIVSQATVSEGEGGEGEGEDPTGQQPETQIEYFSVKNPLLNQLTITKVADVVEYTGTNAPRGLMEDSDLKKIEYTFLVKCDAVDYSKEHTVKVKAVTTGEGESAVTTYEGSTTIEDLKAGTYTVTEVVDGTYIFDEKHTYTVNTTYSSTTAEVYNGQTGAVTVTNTYTYQPELVDVIVNKVWDDVRNQDGKRPTEVQIQLCSSLPGDAEPTAVGDPVTLNVSNGWAHIFENLPKYYNGSVIDYTVAEVAVPTGYSSGVSADADQGDDFAYTVTNSYTPETVKVDVTKVWNDHDNRDQKRPENITVELWKSVNGNAAEQVPGTVLTLSAANEWKGSFSDLPKYEAVGKLITYTVKEILPQGSEYSTNMGADADETDDFAYTITNTYTPGQTQVTVTKVWADANDQDGKRPDSIEVRLLANGEKYEDVTLNAANGWSYTWNGLYTKTAGAAADMVYTVEELGYTVMVPNPEYNAETNPDVPETVEELRKVETLGYTSVVEGYAITNTYIPETVEIKGSKTWSDYDNEYKTRPESIVINLWADGEKIASKTVTEADGWAWKFDKVQQGETEVALYKYRDHGVEIKYTITEDKVDRYTTTVNGYDVTNTFSISFEEPPKKEEEKKDPIVIEEPDVPLAELPEEDVPLAELPEEEVPLAMAPATGDASMIWMALSALSGAGLFLTRKKREDEE